MYRLLAKKRLESEASRPVGEVIIKPDVGYDMREDGHSMEMFDWLRFLEFADDYLKSK